MLAANEKPEGGNQASTQAAHGGAQGKSATSPGKEHEDDAAAAAKKASQYAVVAAAATAKKAAEGMAAEAKRQKVKAAATRIEEVAEAQSVRNETRIAMDGVMTIFDNVPRAGCPAPDVLKSAPSVVFVFLAQSDIRGRPNRTMPVFQTNPLQ